METDRNCILDEVAEVGWEGGRDAVECCVQEEDGAIGIADCDFIEAEAVVEVGEGEEGGGVVREAVGLGEDVGALGD